ncbi:MAG: ATP-grasp domain-containing protein, partial [Candidatus Geothermarchaeales archaeon]
MRLLEHEAKRLFAEYGIPVPEGVLISKPFEAKEAIRKTATPAVLKAQLPIGGRGKAGAVKIVDDIAAAVRESAVMFEAEFQGLRPDSVLVEEFVPHEDEYYVGLVLSRPQRRFVALASQRGGVDVEELSARGALHMERIHPVVGLMDFQARRLAKRTLPAATTELQTLVEKMNRLMLDKDLELVEINPLVRTNRGLVALDAKVTVDDNSLFRQPSASEAAASTTYKDEAQKVARDEGFAFVPLEGEIAVIGNGAGLVMATLDLVASYGGRPACFVDVGGGASPRVVARAVQTVQKELRPVAT